MLREISNQLGIPCTQFKFSLNLTSIEKCKNTLGDWKKDIFQKRKTKQQNKQENPPKTCTNQKNPSQIKLPQPKQNKKFLKIRTNQKTPNPRNSADLAFLVPRSQEIA